MKGGGYIYMGINSFNDVSNPCQLCLHSKDRGEEFAPQEEMLSSKSTPHFHMGFDL